MKTTGKSTITFRVIALAAAGIALVLAVGMSGCSKNSSSATSGDSKAMVEAVGKWYVAQGQLDIAGFKGGLYDPNNLLGVATMTAPPKGAKKENVTYTWAGNTLTIVMPSQQATLTVTASKTAPNTVDIVDTTGNGGKYVMKNDNGVWKIDVAETKKASDAANGSQSASSTP